MYLEISVPSRSLQIQGLEVAWEKSDTVYLGTFSVVTEDGPTYGASVTL